MPQDIGNLSPDIIGLAQELSQLDKAAQKRLRDAVSVARFERDPAMLQLRADIASSGSAQKHQQTLELFQAKTEAGQLSDAQEAQLKRGLAELKVEAQGNALLRKHLNKIGEMQAKAEIVDKTIRTKADIGLQTEAAKIDLRQQPKTKQAVRDIRVALANKQAEDVAAGITSPKVFHTTLKKLAKQGELGAAMAEEAAYTGGKTIRAAKAATAAPAPTTPIAAEAASAPKKGGMGKLVKGGIAAAIAIPLLAKLFQGGSGKPQGESEAAQMQRMMLAQQIAGVQLKNQNTESLINSREVSNLSKLMSTIKLLQEMQLVANPSGPVSGGLY